MKNRFYVENVEGNFVQIAGEEFFHLHKVLRLKPDNEIEVFDKEGKLFSAVILNILDGYANIKILKEILNPANPKVQITVFQALPKGEKLELIIQKLSELGIEKIVPFISTFCVAKENSNKIERLNKIALQACKQCGRTRPLTLENVISFAKLLIRLKEFDTVIFANETENISQQIELKGKIAIIVGSEGGFSENEILSLKNAGVKSISLGNRILRTETASIALSTIVLYLLGELSL